MGLILVVIGIVLLILGYFLIGLILVVVGILLFFVPWDGGYGYSHYRRRPPP